MTPLQLVLYMAMIMWLALKVMNMMEIRRRAKLLGVENACALLHRTALSELELYGEIVSPSVSYHVDNCAVGDSVADRGRVV